MNKKRVIVGMSGGVDSSVAAYLLKGAGYEVIGVTMKLWPQDCMSRSEDKCCGPQAIADARGVAHALGIPHYVVDEAEPFSNLVIKAFVEDYKKGLTPNPCVLCNEKVKFGNLHEKARALGADFIATGHYAQVIHSKESPTGRPILKKGVDPKKDQSYFLFSLSDEQLDFSLFPLGHMEKTEIREIAKKLGLKVADKEDSQEICFVPGKDYRKFLKEHLEKDNSSTKKGAFYDTLGNKIADHEGIEYYTIGQRKGLPSGAPKPRYVIDIEPESHHIILGYEEDLATNSFTLNRVTWHINPSKNTDSEGSEIKAEIKIRHGAQLHSARIVTEGQVTVKTEVPLKSVTPGQACVFYQGDTVIGGGWIERKSSPTN